MPGICYKGRNHLAQERREYVGYDTKLIHTMARAVEPRRLSVGTGAIHATEQSFGFAVVANEDHPVCRLR